jgi:hypothetical protein
MTDILQHLANALAAVAVWLDTVSPIPWPLGLALLLPPAVVGFRFFVWFMRGMMWPTTCAYNTTKGGFCKNDVNGEWRKCRRHRRRWTRATDSHTVEPGRNRWEVRDKKGRGLKGAAFLRNRRGVDTLLFQRDGFARRPGAMLDYLFHDLARIWWSRLRSLTRVASELDWRSLVSISDDDRVGDGVSPRAHLAADVMRVILPTLVAGFLLTGVAIPLSGGIRAGTQYVASTCFVAVWAFSRLGLWEGDQQWLTGSFTQTLVWLGFFLAAALIGNLLSNVATTPPAQNAPAHQGTMRTSCDYTSSTAAAPASPQCATVPTR